MVYIKFIKDTEKCKIGEIYKTSKSSAENYVNNGFAIYNDEPNKECKTPLNIPERLKGFNFVLIDSEIGEGKKPLGLKWQNKEIRANDPKLIQHLENGHNYGVQSNGSYIRVGEELRHLIIVDFDDKEFQDKVLPLFPETFTTTSGSPKKCYHLWFASDRNEAFKIKDENQNTLCDCIGKGNQIIAPGSKHKSGSVYSIVKDIPFAFIPYAELEAILKPYDKLPKREKKLKTPIIKTLNDDIASKAVDSVSMQAILREIGINTSKNPTNCFAHPSKMGQCFSYTEEVAHCFHCENSWNKFTLIRDAKKLTDKETFEWFAEKVGLTEELKKARKEFKEQQKVDKHIGIEGADIFSTIGQATTFIKSNPIYYDINAMFWEWNTERYCYEMTDEVNLLNKIRKSMRVDTIDSKRRAEIVAALKQVGREQKPITKPKDWIQFKETLVNIKTGEKYHADHKYFLTNPIPHKLGETEETPTINRLFKEWVVKVGVQDESWVNTLQEATAYALTDDLFMQRWFAMTGAGLNGKGTWSSFVRRLVGKENCVSIQIKKISSNNFAISSIYRKPVAFAGEVSYEDLTNANTLKLLTGEDPLDYEFKGKNSFTEESITTIYILTNSLPRTPDKSLGFYRRALIIDFPNQFSIQPDLLDQIPQIEYENFCLKAIRILKELYQRKQFTNEGTIEEREKRYEDRSNPLPTFIEEFCEETIGKYISLQKFTNVFNVWLKERRLRIFNVRNVGAMLRNEGYQIGKPKTSDKNTTITAIMNLDWNTQNTENTENPSQNPYGKSTSNMGILSILGIPEPQNKPEIIHLPCHICQDNSQPNVLGNDGQPICKDCQQCQRVQ